MSIAMKCFIHTLYMVPMPRTAAVFIEKLFNETVLVIRITSMVLIKHQRFKKNLIAS